MMDRTEYKSQLEEFDAIRPYEPEEMKDAFESLLADRQFNVIMKGFAPWLPKAVRNGLLRLAFRGVKTPLDFQRRFMKPVVKHIIRKYTDGCTFDDSLLVNSLSSTANDQPTRFTFISNHRDIVLDSAFLDVMLFDHDYPTTVEIGIGDNLLIYPWIKRLVRMNKAFTVRRGLTPKEMLVSSQLMSRYIHFAVTQKQENIWLAQREGRAKDSDDRTQESVLKMLAMGGTVSGRTADHSGDCDLFDTAVASGSPASRVGSGSPADSIKELNIVPLTISYEYDPCDYLKAQEMQQKRDNPGFKKSRQDDLDNMKTGIFGNKGRVCYCCGTPVNEWIDELRSLSRQEFFAELARRMDQEIHRGYVVFPANRVAAGADCTDAERAAFNNYIESRLDMVTIPNPDRDFLRERLLTMYANPYRNKMAAVGHV